MIALGHERLILEFSTTRHLQNRIDFHQREAAKYPGSEADFVHTSVAAQLKEVVQQLSMTRRPLREYAHEEELMATATE